MTRRYSILYLGFTLSALIFLGMILLHVSAGRVAPAPLLRESARLVRDLQLTDLCLFTEARYTRHPAMADLNAPFQEHPVAFEHFPSGSILLPPPRLMRRYAEHR